MPKGVFERLADYELDVSKTYEPSILQNMGSYGANFIGAMRAQEDQAEKKAVNRSRLLSEKLRQKDYAQRIMMHRKELELRREVAETRAAEARSRGERDEIQNRISSFKATTQRQKSITEQRRPPVPRFDEEKNEFYWLAPTMSGAPRRDVITGTDRDYWEKLHRDDPRAWNQPERTRKEYSSEELDIQRTRAEKRAPDRTQPTYPSVVSELKTTNDAIEGLSFLSKDSPKELHERLKGLLGKASRLEKLLEKYRTGAGGNGAVSPRSKANPFSDRGITDEQYRSLRADGHKDEAVDAWLKERGR